MSHCVLGHGTQMCTASGVMRISFGGSEGRCPSRMGDALTGPAANPAPLCLYAVTGEKEIQQVRNTAGTQERWMMYSATAGLLLV